MRKEKVNAKEIIFRIGDVGNGESVGWVPYSKAIKTIVFDYLEPQYKNAYSRATFTSEIFSILADWDNFYRENNQLTTDGYFFKLNKYFLDEWKITKGVLQTSTVTLQEMGWIDKKIEKEHIDGHPQDTPYYKINHEKVIKDIQKKYPNTYKLF